MILFDFKCKCGNVFEAIVRDASVESVGCKKCGELAEKVPSFGGIQCDSAVDVKWLGDACKTLLPDDHKPIESRGEYKQYLKSHNITERA